MNIVTLKETLSQLLQEQETILKVILFGSHTRGTAGPDSDLDLLVIGNFKQRILHRRMALYRLIRGLHVDIAIDLLPLREDEIMLMLAEGDTFIKEALDTGTVVYEKAH